MLGIVIIEQMAQKRNSPISLLGAVPTSPQTIPTGFVRTG
jgi:hypothetical protein